MQKKLQQGDRKAKKARMNCSNLSLILSLIFVNAVPADDSGPLEIFFAFFSHHSIS